MLEQAQPQLNNNLITLYHKKIRIGAKKIELEQLTLKLNGNVIEPWFIKASYEKVGNFPTPYGWMTMSYLTNRIEYLKNERCSTPLVEIRVHIDNVIKTMEAIKAYLEKE